MRADRAIPTATRATRLAANVGLLAAVLFGVTAVLTTQVASLRATLPGAADPYDAVVSVAIILVPFVVVVTWLRSVRNRGPAGIPDRTRSRIHRGLGLSAVLILSAMGADLVAILVHGAPEAPPAIVGVIALTEVCALAAAIMLIRASMTRLSAPAELELIDPEPDTIDDVVAIGLDGARELGAVVPAAGSWLVRAVTLVDRIASSAGGPRKHRLLWIVFLSIGLGAAGVAFRGIVEGPWASLGAALVYGAIMTSVIAAGLGILGPYLRVLRPS